MNFFIKILLIRKCEDKNINNGIIIGKYYFRFELSEREILSKKEIFSLGRGMTQNSMSKLNYKNIT